MTDQDIAKEIRAAVREGDTERFGKLIREDKKRLAMMTPFGTWLQVAASFGKLDIVKMLVEEMGVDLNARGGSVYDGGPLYVAASEGHTDVARYLLDHKAELDVSEPTRNPLFAAIYAGHADIARLLLDAGIDTGVRYSGSSMENTDALAFAREHGKEEIEKLLVADRARRGVADDPATGRKVASPHSEIIEHMASHFGPVQDLALTEILPASGVTIHVIPKLADEDAMLLFTAGMSDRAQNVPKGQKRYRYTELMIRLPADWPLDKLDDPRYYWPIKWLKQIAVYPQEQNGWLGGQFAIISNGEPPEPLGPGTQQTCLLVLCETEEVNPIRCDNGRSVLLYSLMPLYTQERDLEKAQGLPALMDRLTEKEISPVVDPGRPNVALGGRKRR